MNEPRQPDLLDRRIEEGLRRRFPVPASLDSLAERARPRAGVRPGPRIMAPWIALAAAAAVVVALAWWTRARSVASPGAGRTASGPVEGAGLAPLADVLFCRSVGPVQDGESRPGAPHSPDLARLYHDMVACLQGSDSTACGAGDELAERLSATYGQPLELRPEAAGLLHGPFGSEEWPTGTIVTSRADGETSVLVADRGTNLECCVLMRLAEDSGLQLFTWPVGDVVLTEITPSAEPRLIGYFQ